MDSLAWIATGTGVGTVVNGSIAAWIAYQQYTLGQRQHTHELYEKRFAVFKATQKFLSTALLEGKLEYPDVFQFRPSLQDSNFLFDAPLTDYLEEIHKKSIEMIGASKKLLGADQNGLDKQQLIETEHALLGWLIEQLPVLITKFRPYLKV